MIIEKSPRRTWMGFSLEPSRRKARQPVGTTWLGQELCEFARHEIVAGFTRKD